MEMKEQGRIKRHARLRKTVQGTQERPRLSIHGSHQNFYVQFIDDVKGHTLCSLSTRDKDFLSCKIKGGNIKAAEKMGELAAQKAKKHEIAKVVFDRGGWLFHGRVKAFADACRKNGLQF